MKRAKFRRITALLLMICLLFVNTVSAEKIENITEDNETLQAEPDASQDESEASSVSSDSDAGEHYARRASMISESTDQKDETDEVIELEESMQASIENDVTALNASYTLQVGTHVKYMSGFSDGTFRPDNNLTRAELSVILYGLLTNAPAPSTGQFTDVNDTGWYGDAVNSLAAAGILKGDGDGKFRPNDGITRAEVVTILALLTETSESTSINFSDVNTSHWAYGSIVTAVASSWVSGYPDGTFRPNTVIKRSEITIIMNQILERHDDLFGADATDEDKLFYDVSSSHWAFLNIMEAGQRVENPVVATKYITTTAALNFRDQPSTSGNIITTLPINSVLTVIDDTSYGEWIKASHASYGTGYVHSDYVTYTSSGGTDSGDGVISTTTASIPQYKTIYISGSINGASGNWTSDNTDIAGVFTLTADATKAFIYAKAVGTTYIRLRDSDGNIKSTCTVTVTAAEAVRFAYADPNTPFVGVSFNLYAVTDTGKSDVRFVVTGPAAGTYETSTYTVETKNASTTSTVVPANSVRIFQREVTFNTAGEYTVKVYSKSGGSWSNSYTSFTLFVVADQDKYTTSTVKRSASNDIITVIAGFEGKGTYPGEVYIDTLSSGYVPTVGYGYVPSKNTTFYNNLTETEMIAMLRDTINNGSYVKNLQTFQSTYNVKMSQVQFDAMVSFGYNLGTGYFKDGTYNTFTIFLNAMTDPSLPVAATINAGAATLYNQASASSTSLGTVPNGAAITINRISRESGDVDNLWYEITYNGQTGWIRGGYARFTSTTTRDLEYIDEQLFGSNLLQWNSAGGTRLPGLVYRRLGEAKIFCYGNYEDAKSSSANYKKNVGFDAPTNVPGLELK